MSDDLAKRLSESDPLPAWRKAQAARIAELEAENASLAANQCIHGIHGDNQGNSYCPRIAELEAALRYATEYVGRLAVALAEKHYPDQRFELLPDLLGRIDQIDNMTCELTRAALVGGKKDE